MSRRFFIYLLLAAAAFLLQLRLDAAEGVKINFVLAALVAVSFCASLAETFFLALIGAFFLSWQPAWSPELAVFVALPSASNILKNIFPWKRWFMLPVALFLGALAMYLFFGTGLLANQPVVFFRDLAGELIFGLLAFVVSGGLVR